MDTTRTPAGGPPRSPATGTRSGTGPGRLGWAVAALVLAAVVGSCTGDDDGAPAPREPGEDATADCSGPADPLDPPCNTALADSPWAASHRGSYAQASSPWPGPVDDRVTTRHVEVPGIPIQLQFTAPDDDGDVAVWGSLVNTVDNRAVVKVDHRSGELLDVYLPAEREAEPPVTGTGGITGAYNVLDRDGRFIVGRQRSLEVYEDAVPGDHASGIELARRFALPERAFCGPDDVIAGMTMTYAGEVALVSERGVVALAPRDPDDLRDEAVASYSINGGRCDGDVDGELETVSNSLAADEDGGIYVVTSSRVHRLDRDPDTGALGPTWDAPYEATGGGSAIRLGAGSGSTPTLMGTGGDDRFVVITDGRALMHLVLMWRDEVPDDWQPVEPGADRRIACQVPVTFGDPAATRSLSEQSVLVSGNSAFVVNNRLADESAFAGLPPQLANALAALRGGDPAQAPKGLERIDWDPERRTCRTVWANTEVSIPNGIPTMSRASGLVYGIGLRGGTWGVQGLDGETGADRLWIPGPNEPCSPEALDAVDPAQRPALDALLVELPNSCENSFYAATEIGPDGSIYTGTFLGISSYIPTG